MEGEIDAAGSGVGMESGEQTNENFVAESNPSTSCGSLISAIIDTCRSTVALLERGPIEGGPDGCLKQLGLPIIRSGIIESCTHEGPFLRPFRI